MRECEECGKVGRIKLMAYPERMTARIILCDECYNSEIEKANKQAFEEFQEAQFQGGSDGNIK